MGKIYLITGSDEYAIKGKSREIITSLCGKDAESNPCLEIIHGDSPDLDLPRDIGLLIESVATPAFLGSAKTIWLKNLDFEKLEIFSDDDNKKSKGAKTLEEVFENFLDLLKSGIPDETTLVMSVFAVDKRSAFFKACQKTAEISLFEKVDLKSKDWNDKLRTVIHDSCRQNNVRISEDAVAFVSETAGVDVGRVKSELEKLFAYVYPGKAISLADCKNICSRTPETAGWTFSNALAERNLKEAIDILNVFVNMDSKSPEMKIIYAVMGQFQDLIKIKAVCRKLGLKDTAGQSEFESKLNNVPPSVKLEIKDESIFKMHPYRAWKVFSSATRFSDNELASILSEILKANKALVSGAVSPRMELEALAIRICRKNR